MSRAARGNEGASVGLPDVQRWPRAVEGLLLGRLRQNGRRRAVEVDRRQRASQGELPVPRTEDEERPRQPAGRAGLRGVLDDEEIGPWLPVAEHRRQQAAGRGPGAGEGDQ